MNLSSTCERPPLQETLHDLARRPLENLREMADDIRKQKAGDIVHYNVNRHIEPTNVCRFACTFCSFARHYIEDEGAFRYSVAEIIERTANDDRQGITEYHLVGGVDMKLGVDYYVDLIAALRAAHPNVVIKSLSAVEIGDLARRCKMSYAEVLTRFRDAGANALTGGGAEIFAWRVRKQICATKIKGEQWLEIHETAHRVGMFSNATILFGHFETMEERIEHILAIRDLQDRSGGFRAFIPLPFVPYEGTRMATHPAPSGEEYLKMIALSRIALDNFDTIKAYWPAAGVVWAQKALDYGANDLDGTVTEETIYHSHSNTLTRAQIEELITQSGRIPVKRQ